VAVKQACKRRADGAHEAALAFIRELLAVGAGPGPTRAASRGRTPV